MQTYGLTEGHVDYATFEADPDNFLVNYPALTRTFLGENYVLSWKVATDNLIALSSRIVRLNSRLVEAGLFVPSPWTIVMTTGMSQYILSRIFDEQPSADVTLRTYDQERGAWRTFQGIAWKPYSREREQLDPVANLYLRRYLIEFRCDEELFAPEEEPEPEPEE